MLQTLSKSLAPNAITSTEENGRIKDEVDAVALKRVLAYQIGQAMKQDGVTKVEMAKRMHTSRTQLPTSPATVIVSPS
jgi:hypothetical protein